MDYEVILTAFKGAQDIEICAGWDLTKSDIELIDTFAAKWKKLFISLKVREAIDQEKIPFHFTHSEKGWYYYMNNCAYTKGSHLIDSSIRKSIVVTVLVDSTDSNRTPYVVMNTLKKRTLGFPEVGMTWATYNSSTDPYTLCATKAVEIACGARPDQNTVVKIGNVHRVIKKRSARNFSNDGIIPSKKNLLDYKMNVYCNLQKVTAEFVSQLKRESFQRKIELFELSADLISNSTIAKSNFSAWNKCILEQLIKAGSDVYVRKGSTTFSPEENVIMELDVGLMACGIRYGK